MLKLNISKEVIVVISIAVIIAAELLFGLPFTVGNIVQVNAKIRKMKKDLETIERDWPRKDAYLKQQLELEVEIKRMESKYVPMQQSSALLSFISSESKNYDIEIQGQRPGKIQNYTKSSLGQFNYLPIETEGRGGFHNLARFLESLQKSQYFFEITELTITHAAPYNSIKMTICGLEKE
ncbi:MAG: type 4a pilus biogenesis protein PilO [Candidatus Omnitrophica bacterium]|nr:type 4a pilus biogenesis protein PilO [Candidatus Omnitrophota bacterium]